MSDLSNEADSINDAIAEEAPVMPDAESGVVPLLRGLYDSDEDKWHDVGLVRELTGADEERLAEVGSRPDITLNEYMGEILKLAVVSIGDLEVAKLPGLVDKLIMADRDLLYLGITKCTYGRTRVLTVSCRSCGTDNDVEIDLDEDFMILNPANLDPKEPLSVKTSKGVVKMRFPTGETTALATAVKDEKAPSDPEINTFLLAAGLVSDDITELEDGLEWARNLNLGDRKKLLKALSTELGPKLEEVDTHCSECESDMIILLDWVSLLLS